MTNQGWSTLLSGKNGIRSLTLAGGVALHAINVYIVVTILPSLVDDIGGKQYYSWAATIFVTASLIGASLAAKLLGRTGPRVAYVISALTFAIGTFVCSMAPNMLIFLLGRLIQGFGGGFLLSLSYSMVRIVFDRALWPRAMGLISGMWGIATLLGPAIGGIFAEYGLWRASFWTVGILAIGFSLIAYKVLPKENQRKDAESRLPVIQLVILISLVLIISAGSALELSSAKIGGLVIGFILLFILAKVEKTSQNRMMPAGTFTINSVFFPLYSLMLIIAIAVNGAELYLPLFLQDLHGEGPLMAGYIAALMSIGWTCGSLMSAGIKPSLVRFIVIISPILEVFGMLALLWLIPSEYKTTGFITVISVALIVIGIGAGSCWPHLLTRILQCASDEDSLRASASLTSIQLFATALSAALAGTVTNLAGIFQGIGNTGMLSAANALFVFLIVLLCIGIPCALFVSRAMRDNP